MGGEDFSSRSTRGTYKSKSVCSRVRFNVFYYIPIHHPIQNELQGGNGNTSEGYNVGVSPVPPHDSLLVKLQSLRENGKREWKEWMTHPLNFSRVSVGTSPGPFDANLTTIEGSFVYVSNSSRADRVGTGDQISAQKSVRLRQYFPSATHPHKYA